MFDAFYDFMNTERAKSSTKVMAQVVDEWEHVFAKDVNLILLRIFMKFIQENSTFTKKKSLFFNQ